MTNQTRAAMTTQSHIQRKSVWNGPGYVLRVGNMIPSTVALVHSKVEFDPLRNSEDRGKLSSDQRPGTAARSTPTAPLAASSGISNRFGLPGPNGRKGGNHRTRG